jgi:murein DD-endopeptidase MepM/ murein hydrolase activator NlpD
MTRAGILMVVLLALAGCAPQADVQFVTATPLGGAQVGVPTLSAPQVEPQSGAGGGEALPASPVTPTSPPFRATPAATPSPNPTRQAVVDPTEDQIHVVQFGDTLTVIAQQYGVTAESIMDANNMTDGNILAVGQQLRIPLSIQYYGPSFKIIPDAELIYGPSVGGFNPETYLAESDSWLANYSEVLNDQVWTGPQIVQRVAHEQSINPRLLLALLEYENRLLTRSTVSEEVALYPLNYTDKPNQVYGLYRQLDWAGKMLQTGYYGWKYRGMAATLMADGTRAGLDPTLNAGTAGVHLLLAQTRNFEQWLNATDYSGFYSTYVFLFGDPFQYAVEPLLPPDLSQPRLTFPWAQNETWYYTGGPHGGWGSGSAWAALDFVPVAQVQGCELPEEYARAVANGVIAVSTYGLVILDLDGDGDPGTGWTIYYLHLASEGRQVEAGDRVRTGDPLGVPSCEGGVSFASHLHIARRYNGEWITADCTGCLTEAPTPPLVMDGWTTFTFDSEYDGSLTRGEAYREACVCREPFNTLGPADRE